MNNFLPLIFTWLCICEHTFGYTVPAETVTVGTLSWVVKLSNWNNCFSGVLVSDRYILTSAHGLNSFLDQDCLTAFFSNSVSNFSIRVESYILHPKFKLRDDQILEQEFDFAIIYLSESVTKYENFTSFPHIDISSNSFEDLSHIKEIYAAGYAGSNILRLAKLKLVSVRDFYILNYDGAFEHGDSGGPLFYFRNNTPYLLGIGDGSYFKKGENIGYEPLKKYLDFISSNTDLLTSEKHNSELVANWNKVGCITYFVFSVLTSIFVGELIILIRLYYKKFVDS